MASSRGGQCESGEHPHGRAERWDVTELLGRIVERPDPTGWWADATDVARVHVPPDTFATLTTLGFAEIIRFGADSPAVVRRLRAALDELASRTTGGRGDHLARLESLLDEATGESLPPAFLALAAEPDARGLG